MIEIGGDLDETISVDQIDQAQIDNNAKQFMEFLVDYPDNRAGFVNLPKESYVFFRDLSAIYNNEFGFHFFQNGLLTLIKDTVHIPTKNRYYKITFNQAKFPLATQLRLLVWENRLETDFSTAYKYVCNRTRSSIVIS